MRSSHLTLPTSTAGARVRWRAVQGVACALCTASLLSAGALALGGCGSAAVTPDAPAPLTSPTAAPTTAPALLEPALVLERMPTAIARVGGRTFLAWPRGMNEADATLAEWTGGALAPYPSSAANDLAAGPDSLVSVSAVHADSRGWLWILDGGAATGGALEAGPAPEGQAKLVVWDTRAEREVFRHVFSPEIAPSGVSSLVDLAVDEVHGFVYLTQVGMAGPASLVALEVHRGRARRAIDAPSSGEGDASENTAPGGELVPPHAPRGGLPRWINPSAIAVTPDGETLYWGASDSERLFSVATRLLRDPRVSQAELRAAIASIPKPASAAIAFAPDGRLFATDMEHARIVELDVAGGPPLERTAAPRFSYPGSIEIDAAGGLWFTSGQPEDTSAERVGDALRPRQHAVWRVPLP